MTAQQEASSRAAAAAQVQGWARRGAEEQCPLGAEPVAAESPPPPNGALGSHCPEAGGLCGYVCVQVGVSGSVRVWVRARSPESGVGGCACLRAGLQEARLPRPP